MSFCQGSLRLSADGRLHLRRPLEANAALRWSHGESAVQLGSSDADPPTLLDVTSHDARLLVDDLGRLLLGDRDPTSNAGSGASLVVHTEDVLSPPVARPVALCVTSNTYPDALTVDWRGHVHAAGGISSVTGRLEALANTAAAVYTLAPGEVVQATARCSAGTFAMAKALYPAEGEPLALFEEGWRTSAVPSVHFVSGPAANGTLELVHAGVDPRSVDWSVLVLLSGTTLPGGTYRPPPPPPPPPVVDEGLPSDETIDLG